MSIFAKYSNIAMSAIQKDNAITGQSVNETDRVLHGFLEFLQDKFNKSAENAGDSKSLLELGLKTEYAQGLETFLNNPMEALYNARKSFDGSLQNFVNAMVSTYLKSKKESVSHAVWAENANCNLYYCISLKEDTLDNRININEFFEFYDEYSLSRDYPVYFHFIPNQYIGNIKYKKEIV